MPTPPPPPDNKTDPWAHLRGSELWADIKGYAESRLKGAGARIKELEQQVGAVEGDTMELARAATRGQELEQHVGAYVEAVVAGLPEAAQSLVPRELAPGPLLQWLAANAAKLQPAERARHVDGSGGRHLATADRDPKAASAARARGWLFGGKR